MAWSIVGSGGVGFADGATGAGHVFTLPAGAAVAGDIIDVRVSSDDVTTTPAGYTRCPNFDETNLGAYPFFKVATGGETTVTIKTGSNTPGTVYVTQIRGGAATPLDVVAKAVSIVSAATSPTATTAALAGTGELSIASAHLGGLQAATQTGFATTGTSGYTVLGNVASAGTGTSDQALAVAASTTAGTAAQAVAFTWTNSTNNQTTLVVTYIPGSGSVGGSAALAGGGTLAAAAKLTIPGASTLTGAGALAAAGSQKILAATALAGSGTLTAAGSQKVIAAAALTASGALGAAGSQTIRASVALAGASTATAAATVKQAASAAFAATGVLSVSAAGSVSGSAALAATGTLTATGSTGDRFVIRPNTGTVTRPSTGFVTRPNTGLVIRP